MRSRLPSRIGIFQLILHLISIVVAFTAIGGTGWSAREIVDKRRTNLFFIVYIAVCSLGLLPSGIQLKRADTSSFDVSVPG